MTAGLPGTQRVGSTLHRRALAAILALSIAAAPAHACSGVALILDSTPFSTALVIASETFETNDDAASELPAEPAVAAPIAQPDPTVPAPESASDDPSSAPSIDQVIYKGVVGNILEAVPLDPEQRVQLQRGNAVLNNAFTGRTLALLLGIASPPLMIVGLIWGIWSAANIKPAQPQQQVATARTLLPETQAQQPATEDQLPEGSPTDENPPIDPGQIAAQTGE